MNFTIYIIINKINNKFYIGKTTNSTQERFQRHINDALSHRLNTPLAHAIRKYGAENFYVESLDTAETLEELDNKEIYWIQNLNAMRDGYNASLGGEGGNTYARKTEAELDSIKAKIRESKIGDNNPHASAVKCKSVLTGEELVFSTIVACKEYFNEKNHNFITRRCARKTKYVYKGEWVFAYQNDDYIDDYSFDKNIKRKKKVKIIDLKTLSEYVFDSYTKAELHFGLRQGFFSKDAYKYKNNPYWEKAGYKIVVLE